MHWYALYTKPRNEKKVTQGLIDLGINAYCPMVTEIKQWSDRKKKVQVPLISSYVFVQLDANERNKVFSLPGVIRYLFWLGKPARVRNEEIEALKLALNKSFFSINLGIIVVGETLELTEGLFRGHKGIVQEVNTKTIKVTLAELGYVITFNK